MLFAPDQRAFAEAVSALSYANPFSARRIELEQEALGADFRPAFAVWSAGPDAQSNNANLIELESRATRLVRELAPRVGAGEGEAAELDLYRRLARFALYADFGDRLWNEHIVGNKQGPVEWYDEYEQAYDATLDVGRPRGTRKSTAADRAHLLSLFFQLRRAFHHIFTKILGGSAPAAHLREQVWQSIFTRDMHRYQRALSDRMNAVPTLILGPSGTGKELIARAIGCSLYIPFSARAGSFDDERAEMASVNLTALSATLIESELFGHKKGSFTGATADKAGWLESCGVGGAIFVDEIGDLDGQTQVKLLRVLESRKFARIGETHERDLLGKLIFATNRNLELLMEQGTFREDFYYRLNADVVVSPPLSARLADDPGELDVLVEFLARRLVGEEEAGPAAEEVLGYIGAELAGYTWPGNVRELEQCVRNVLIRGVYGRRTQPGSTPEHPMAAALDVGELTADELLRQYCTRVYARTGSYEETARLLRIDRRTVKSRVDEELLAELKT